MSHQWSSCFFSYLKVVPHVETIWRGVGEFLWFPLRKCLHCWGDGPVNVSFTRWSRISLLAIQLQNVWGLCHEGRFSQGTKWSIRCVTLTLSAVTTINKTISIVFILILLSQKPILILENVCFFFVFPLLHLSSDILNLKLNNFLSLSLLNCKEQCLIWMFRPRVQYIMLKQGMYELHSLVILYVPDVCWGRDSSALLQLGTGVFFTH